jgi:hypothetical protein
MLSVKKMEDLMNLRLHSSLAVRQSKDRKKCIQVIIDFF